jgi:hypothetical protein
LEEIMRPGRRTLSILLPLTTALLLVLPSPAQAVDKFKFSGNTAFAEWDLENASVFITASDGLFQSPPGPPAPEDQIFVDVNQQFCDQATDELVIRDFFGFEGDVSVEFDELDAATAEGSIVLDGIEFRVPDCGNPDFENGHEIELGQFPVELSVQWASFGPTLRSKSNFHFFGPDCKFFSHGTTTFREATATGEISGELPGIELGSLGDSDFAEIDFSRSMDMQIGSCFG